MNTMDIAGGVDTSRLSAAEADMRRRAERDAKALTYLRRRGAEDVAVILGLLPSPRRPRKEGGRP